MSLMVTSAAELPAMLVDPGVRLVVQVPAETVGGVAKVALTLVTHLLPRRWKRRVQGRGVVSSRMRVKSSSVVGMEMGTY